MSFQHFYGLIPQKLHESGLASIPESKYRLASASCGTLVLPSQ
jgi:hypothetical protein